MRGETAKEVLGCREILADAYGAAGRFREAERLYREILEKLERYYPLQRDWYRKVCEKERQNHSGMAEQEERGCHYGRQGEG
ncbi:MAG: hypothetical protein Q4F29_01230 [Lachnospiraceae bacterium]|nr:hypothetical protein [Lachnospiraceae bacterium]